MYTDITVEFRYECYDDKMIPVQWYYNDNLIISKYHTIKTVEINKIINNKSITLQYQRAE